MRKKVEIRPNRNIIVNIEENPQAQGNIFFIHGLGGRADQWRLQIPVFENNYTLIIPELYGLNGSDAALPQPDNNPYSFPEIYADLAVLFDLYKGDRNFIIGHSYGGAFAAELCFNNQSDVEKLILLAPLPCISDFKAPAVYKLPIPILKLIRPLLEKLFIKLAFNQTQNQELIRYEQDQSKAHPLSIIKYLILGMTQIPSIDVSQLQTPTLLIQGMNDNLVPTSQQEAFYSRIPHLKLEKLPNVAHLVQLEAANLVNTKIKEFIEE